MHEVKRAVARDVARFVALTIASSAVFALLIVHTGHMATGRWLYVRGAMWGPAIAVGILSWMRGRPFCSVGWTWRTDYTLAAFALSAGSVVVVYGLASLSGLASFPDPRMVTEIARDFGWTGAATPMVVVGYALLMATFGLLPAIPSVLGEEIGWRGYLVPELARVYSFTTTALLSGVIWAVWHYPMIVFADFSPGVPTWYSLTCFTVFVMSSAVICAWLRLKSGSIWPSVVLHATNNLLLQDVFAPLTIDTGRTKFVVGEFGFLLPLVALGAAIVCWRRRAEVEAPSLVPEPAAPTAQPYGESLTALA